MSESRNFKTFKEELHKKHPVLFGVVVELPIVLFISIACTLLDMTGFFKSVEDPVLDSNLRLHPMRIERTVLVDIDDDSYAQLFKSTSPLKAEAVDALLEQVTKANVPLVVVDIDTSDISFQALRHRKYHGRRIIWAQDVLTKRQPTKLGKRQRLDLIAGGVLGGSPDSSIESGLAVMTLDRDGVVRGYPSKLEVTESAHSANVVEKVTLPWMAISAIEGTKKDPEDELARFNLMVDPETYDDLSAKEFFLKGDDAREFAKSWNEAADGKIVLVGGTYAEARDRVLTPIGYVDGVKVIGLAIESQLQKTAVHLPKHFLMFLADILCGIIFAAIAHAISKGRMVITTILMPILAWSFSFIVFQLFSLWVDFIPVLFGVYLHMLHGHVHHHAKLVEELEKLRGTSKTI